MFIITRTEYDFTVPDVIDHKHVLDSIWENKREAMARLDKLTKKCVDYDAEYNEEGTFKFLLEERSFDHGERKTYQSCFGEEEYYTKKTVVSVFEVENLSNINLIVGAIHQSLN